MSKLLFSDGVYTISKKTIFKEKLIKKELIDTAFNFAYEMSFGEGFHRSHRSGGSIIRNQKEMFENTFQGKLAELVLNDELLENGISTSGVDLGVMGEGLWDQGDLVAEGKHINVKSMAFFSNLLLLECKDWNKNAEYIHDEGTFSYDYFASVRIKPNIKQIFNDNDFSEKQKLYDVIDKTDFYYDLPGVMSKKTLEEIIRRQYIIKKGDQLNHTTMDADNYYIQSGDLNNIELMYSQLKEI